MGLLALASGFEVESDECIADHLLQERLVRRGRLVVY